MSEQSGSWQPDPYGRHQYRWWDGSEWTDQVSDDGNVTSDPPDGAGAAATPGAEGGGTDGAPPAGDVPQEPAPTQVGWGAPDATTSMPAAGPAATSSTTTTTTEPKKSSSNVPAFILGGVLLLALIGAGAWLLLSGDDDERSREDLIAAVRDDLDLTGSEATCVVDELGEDRLDGILDAGSDVSSSDRDALNAAVSECTGAGEETTDTTTETTETTEPDDEDDDTDDTVPDPFIDAFAETMVSELGITESQARCFAEEFATTDGLDMQELAEDPDAAMSNPALFSAMFEIFETCDIDPMSLTGGGGGEVGEDGELSGLLEGQTYGDNPVLDALWDECEAGDLEACNDLYMHSEFGSEYEEFGLNDGELP